MTRYLTIAMQIAERVRSGELGAGTELPAVRTFARQHAMTASTVGRAYRHLAEAGVITLADRRRARIAPDGGLAAARLLQAERTFRLAGSDDPALQLVIDHAGPTVVPVTTRGSFDGLRALTRHEADGAAIHLRHRSGEYNAPFVRALLRGRGPHLVHLWRREQGLLVAPGNPCGITGAADLARCRVAKRQVGAGTRVLLDQLLLAAGIAPDGVPGPELGSHPEVALAVAAGVTDTGIGVRADANALDLDFIPLTWEDFEIALPEDALGAVRPLVTSLRDTGVRSAVLALGGYDLARSGTVLSLVGATG